jgi:class 3 adenylate cyclase
MTAEQPMFGDARSASPARAEADYRAHVTEIAQGRLRTVCLVVIAIFAADAAYQAVTRAAAFRQELAVRVVALLVLAGVALVNRARRSPLVVEVLAFLVVASVAVDVESAILALGPGGAPFFVGLVLLVVAAGLLLPFGVRATLGFSALAGAAFSVPLLLGVDAEAPRSIADQTFLFFCGIVVAVAGNHMTGTLRRSEFFAREALRVEKDRSDRLLLNVLPQPIAERLKRGEHRIAERVTDASVLFADIVGFTPLSETMTPEELVSVLDEVFSAFDRAATARGLEKIKTIGDAYMVASGLPTPRADHLEAIADMALDMRRAIHAVNEHRGLQLAVRIGIHTGPVVAGVIGTKKFSYDIWGDTVNTASRMESHGSPDQIHVTEQVRTRLVDRYELSEPRVVKVKGKGALTTCFLVAKKDVDGGERREGSEA